MTTKSCSLLCAHDEADTRAAAETNSSSNFVHMVERSETRTEGLSGNPQTS